MSTPLSEYRRSVLLNVLNGTEVKGGSELSFRRARRWLKKEGYLTEALKATELAEAVPGVSEPKIQKKAPKAAPKAPKPMPSYVLPEGAQKIEHDGRVIGYIVMDEGPNSAGDVYVFDRKGKAIKVGVGTSQASMERRAREYALQYTPSKVAAS